MKNEVEKEISTKKKDNIWNKESPEYIFQNPDQPKAIICDLDGTLCLMNGRNPFNASKCDEDLLNEPVASLLRNYKQLGYAILLVSGRYDTYKEPTLRFLEKHAITFDVLLCVKQKTIAKMRY